MEDSQDANDDRERDADGRADDPAARRDAGHAEDVPGPAGSGAGAGGGPSAEDEADAEPVAGDESERLSEEIREELEEMEELRERHLRLAAEFENYRKRTRREMKDARRRGQAELADRLLEALDDLDRVLETPDDAASVDALQEGVEMVQRKLEKELSEAGLARMEPEGERFDPEYHDALLTVPTDDPDENDVVSRVLINGYVFGDRVLRPARVEVKKYSPDEEADGARGGGAREAGGDGEGADGEG